MGRDEGGSVGGSADRSVDGSQGRRAKGSEVEGWFARKLEAWEGSTDGKVDVEGAKSSREVEGRKGGGGPCAKGSKARTLESLRDRRLKMVEVSKGLKDGVADGLRGPWVEGSKV